MIVFSLLSSAVRSEMRGCDVDFLPQFVDKLVEITHIRDTLEFPLMPFPFGDVMIVICTHEVEWFSL